MEEKKSWHTAIMGVALAAGVLSLLVWAPAGEAKSSKRSSPSKAVPGSVAKAPVCDTYLHPKIVKVTPDPVKPGQKITIKGANFGTKACFQKVSFGRYQTNSFQYVNDSTLVATVPNLEPGLTPVNILTAGGASEYILLVEKGKGSMSNKARKATTKKKSKRSKRSKKR